MKRALAVAMALLSATAVAYVIPQFSVLRRLVERRDNLRLTALRVSGTATFSDEGAREAAAALALPAEREIQAQFVISLKPPGRCRADVSAPQGKSSAAVMAQGRRRVEGTEIPSVSEAIGQICPLLGVRAAGEGEGRAGVERHLRELGVEERQSSLARFDGRIVYLLGKPGPDQPQLWVYKDVFQPARVLYKDGQGRKWDVRFRDFETGVAGDAFPRIVEVARGEETLVRFTALAADGRAALADNLF